MISSTFPVIIKKKFGNQYEEVDIKKGCQYKKYGKWILK